jgi:hypothetical protein
MSISYVDFARLKQLTWLRIHTAFSKNSHIILKIIMLTQQTRKQKEQEIIQMDK